MEGNAYQSKVSDGVVTKSANNDLQIIKDIVCYLK